MHHQSEQTTHATAYLMRRRQPMRASMTTVQATEWWNSQTGQLQRWMRRSRSGKRGTKSCRSLRNDHVAVRPALSTVIGRRFVRLLSLAA